MVQCDGTNQQQCTNKRGDVGFYIKHKEWCPIQKIQNILFENTWVDWIQRSFHQPIGYTVYFH